MLKKNIERITLSLMANNKLASIFLLLAICLFLLLSWKNPYSNTSLIGNFDPFPDTLHYIVPVRNFISGEGFSFSREGGSTRINVPPLYSALLLPIYLINFDPRSYYWMNLILGCLSILLLFKICQKFTKSPLLTGLILFLYVTNFVIYWQTSLAMAENLLLPVLFFALYLSCQPLTNKNILLYICFSMACYGSKYIAFPTTGVLFLFLFYRVFKEIRKENRIKTLLFVIVLIFISFLMVNGRELLWFAEKFYRWWFTSDVQAQGEMTWISLKYLPTSFPKYFSALMGFPIYNLWHVKSILPYGLAAAVLTWSVFAIFKIPKYKKFAILLISLIVTQLTFFSLIVHIEGRYAFVFLPVIYTGFAAMAGWLRQLGQKKLGVKKILCLEIAFVLIIATIFFTQNYSSLKTQLLVNFNGSETSWWQVGVTASDQYLGTVTAQENQRIMVISSMSPFLWDFYRKNDYLIMPLTSGQHMVNDPIWGLDFDRQNLLGFYRSELNKGRKIYLDTVGFGRTEWPILEEYRNAGMQLELIKEECFGACKLYVIITR